MTQSEINELIATRTSELAAAQAALDEALALVPDASPPEPTRYRVDLSSAPLSHEGYATDSFEINGQFVSAGAGVVGQVHPDAQHVGNAAYETSTPTEEAPPAVHIVYGEIDSTYPWSSCCTF